MFGKFLGRVVAEVFGVRFLERGFGRFLVRFKKRGFGRFLGRVVADVVGGGFWRLLFGEFFGEVFEKGFL